MAHVLTHELSLKLNWAGKSGWKGHTDETKQAFGVMQLSYVVTSEYSMVNGHPLLTPNQVKCTRTNKPCDRNVFVIKEFYMQVNTENRWFFMCLILLIPLV